MTRFGPNVVVVGIQWGDEGKGKIVDMLARKARFVARFQGGNNAGHTLIVEDGKLVLHLLPSGILHPEVCCVVGNGVVVDPEVLTAELDRLEARGHRIEAGRLALSAQAHVIMPYHRALDGCREEALGGQSIGTTRKGIGPAYEDKAARRGIRLAELVDPKALRERLQATLPEKNRLLTEWYGQPVCEIEATLAWAAPFAARLAPYVTDTVGLLHEACAQGLPVLFEGAQGTFLDVDHGTYPFVTSSNTVAGAAAAGTGVGPGDLHEVVGVAKAYTTRVGAGPFPTEMAGEQEARLRALGHEFGATTGRARRCGWFDAPLVRRACHLNGVTALAITKLDVLSGFGPLRVATGYSGMRRFPTAAVEMEGVEASYEELPGWEEDISGCRRWEDLPDNCQAYLRRLEALVGVPIGLVSVGPERDAVIPIDARLGSLVDGAEAGR